MDARANPTIKQKDAPSMKTQKSLWERLTAATRRLGNVWGIRTICWIFFNNVETQAIPGQVEYAASFAKLEYGKSRVADLQSYAEGLYRVSVEAIKESNDRIEKLLAIVLLAMGWIVSKESFSIDALVYVGIASGILICGRARVVEFIPADFETFTAEAMLYGKNEKEDIEYQFNRAAQYAKVFNANQFVVRLNHIRLTLAVLFLIAGLVAYGLRIRVSSGF